MHLGSDNFNCLLDHAAAILIKSQWGDLLLDYSEHQIDLCLVCVFKHFLDHVVTEHIPHKAAIEAQFFFTQGYFVCADLFVQCLRLTVI